MKNRDWFERIGLLSLLGFVSALQFSIALANICLGAALLMWLLHIANRREIEVPSFFIPLAAYAAATLVSAAFSTNPRASFIDSKQLVLFLIVPMVYEFARASKAPLIIQVIISVGAASAALGIIQYGVLQFDNLGRRPQGALGHYMTYSGLIMLVTCAAAGRVLFSRERLWPLLVMPALLVAIALTFTRSAWIGACAGIISSGHIRSFENNSRAAAAQVTSIRRPEYVIQWPSEPCGRRPRLSNCSTPY